MQFQSIHENFEPICPHITKDECVKVQRLQSPSVPAAPCNRVHFRPLIRPHTDPSLGHCSYLNTCYSEPTYAQSPSIPPFPSGNAQGNYANVSVTRGPTSLPSGLGAGGRGKEKAPCRYLHYEIDWDGESGAGPMGNAGPGQQWRGPQLNGVKASQRKEVVKRAPYKIGVGLGPDGLNKKTVRVPSCGLTICIRSTDRYYAQYPPQWINCDVRRFDCSVLGKFHVIMADPPWDIHMSVRSVYVVYHVSSFDDSS